MAHAAERRAGGQIAYVMIDEVKGEAVALDAKFKVLTTVIILIKVAKLGLVESPAAMKVIWEKLRTLDDGLKRWETMTRLKDPSIYGIEAPAKDARVSERI